MREMGGKIDLLRSIGKGLLAPVVEFLKKRGVTPNEITYFGFFVSIGGALLYAKGHFIWGAFVLFLSGLLDVLDGELARSGNMASRAGALLDSTLDRVGDLFLFGSLAWFYYPDKMPMVLFYLCALFSFLVSYVRARGEGLGVSVRVGPMDRSGRFLFIVVASLFGKRLFLPMMWIFLLLTTLTVARRYFVLYNALRQGG
jgi:phosphatidylglycerophosphate synthase